MAASLLCRVSVSKLAPWSWSTTRALSAAPVLSTKAQPAVDPVKQLFVDKIKEYQTKRSKEGKSPGMRPEDEKQLADELARLKHVYGEGDLSQFPKFDFKKDIKLDWR